MKLKLLIATMLLTVCNAEAQRFTNPVIPGDFADPTIIRLGEKYFATGTSSEWAPHFPVFESSDLVNWTYAGAAFDSKPAWTKSSFWAPELYAVNGKLNLYYTARRATDGVSYIGAATTDDIYRGFDDHGCIVEFGSEAIDPFVFEDDGKLYISWKAYGLDKRPIELLCAELSADGLRLAGEPFTLLKDDNNNGLEGQYIFKQGDYYYILYSIRGCCGARSNYAVSVARSKSFRGAYEHFAGNPILEGDDNVILSCGHGTAVTTPDNHKFYLFHAYLKGGGFYNGRQGFLKELSVNSDGWPFFVGGKHPMIEETAPDNTTVSNFKDDFEDDFEGDNIRKEWTWNFAYSDLNARISNGNLLLSGQPEDDNKTGTALCLRTVSPDYEIITCLKESKALCSGLTLYGDKDNLIVFGREGDNLILKQIRKGEEKSFYKDILQGSIHLKISISEGCRASYFTSADGEQWRRLSVPEDAGDASYLPPWDRSFRPGLIHIGDNLHPAEFTYCKFIRKTK